MKKIISCLLTCAAVCSLASCNRPPNDTLEYTTKESTESLSASESATVKPIDPSEITGDVTVELEDGLTVYESYDSQKHAVKLIFVGNKQYYFPDLNPKYVVNAQYDLFQNGGGFFSSADEADGDADHRLSPRCRLSERKKLRCPLGQRKRKAPCHASRYRLSAEHRYFLLLFRRADQSEG